MARPAEFDRSDVLSKAMDAFWHTGYTATSVSDLVDATSLKPGSLYGAFESKRGLFLEVIENYAGHSLQRVTHALESATSPLQGIEDFFTHLRDELEADHKGRGCLMVNTMLELASVDDEIRIIVTGYLDKIEQHFRDCLHKAQQLGELCSSKDPHNLATFLMTGIWGMRVLSSKRAEPSTYDAVVEQMMFSLKPFPVTN